MDTPSESQASTKDRAAAGEAGTDTGSPEASAEQGVAPAPAEIGGRGGLDPTRYGDWEKNGRCIDF